MTSSVVDPDKPVHAGPSDSWHGVVAPGSAQFPPEAGRYHLYIGLFCPFAHRANLVRALKGLDGVIRISVVKPYPKGDEGWRFPQSEDEYPGATPDRLFGSRFLHEVYFRADPHYAGRYSVPVLYDARGDTVVCNESLELMRWMQTAFDGLLPTGLGPPRTLTLYPEPGPLRAAVDALSPWLQRDFNMGVYRAGFAEDQETYERSVVPVFAALNHLEQLIHRNDGPYVLGSTLTELDILAYPTAIRFDVVYVQHFKVNLGMIRSDYPVVHEWMKNLYWNVKGFRETTNFKHIKENYTKSQEKVNPLGITPLGPYPDIQEGVNLNFSNIQPGAVRHPAVLEYQKTLPRI